MTAVCSRCQADLAPDVLEGLCPRCLLHQALPLELTGDASLPDGLSRPPAPAELASLFPNLEILDLLGQGGMGAVYQARQVKLDRSVALKILPPAVAEDPSFAERFLREARALARLNHPHIVAVHDFGDVNGLYYLLMEFVDGVNLRQALAHGRLTPQQALAIVGELCSALQYAHEMGVIHRDIKPENVLLDRQGHVKVADFGLAKLIDPTRSVERLTGTRQVMGTPHYMAPEQVEKPTEVDHRADIYSLGVVFYEILTGELPLGRFPLPSEKAGVDVRLDGVVLRAIEKEPEQRYQQLSEMKTDVEAAGHVAPPRAQALSETELSDNVKALGCVLLFLAVCLTVLAIAIHATFFAKPVCPIPGLTAQEEQLRGLLATEQSRAKGFNLQAPLSVAPGIEGAVLARARRNCQVPPDELVLGVIVSGNRKEWETNLVFGCRGLYWWQSEPAARHPGFVALPYNEMADRRFVNHGDRVSLGNDQFIRAHPQDIDSAWITKLLYKVRNLMAPAESDDTEGAR